MNKERVNICKELIQLGVWDIDAENGVVTGKRGSHGSKKSRYLKMHVEYKGIGYDFRVHEIIAIASGLDIENATVDHINGDRTDNRISNLQVMTQSDNSRKGNSKLTKDDVTTIRSMLSDGLSCTEIAKIYGVSRLTISDINHNRTWK